MNLVWGEGDVSGLPIEVPFGAVVRGLGAWSVRYGAAVRGANRGIAEAGLEGWLLFLEEGGAEPDLEGEPTAFETTLPIEVPVADGTYRGVLQRRNRYGLRSGNTESTLIVVRDGSAGVAPPGPVEFEIDGGAVIGWRLGFEAQYLSDPDRPALLFRWEVSQLTTGAPVVQTGTVPMVPDADGVGKMAVSVALGDLTAIPTQTGVVALRVRAENGSLVGPWLGTSLSAPNELDAMGPVIGGLQGGDVI
jgi:hypothetical protein